MPQESAREFHGPKNRLTEEEQRNLIFEYQHDALPERQQAIERIFIENHIGLIWKVAIKMVRPHPQLNFKDYLGHGADGIPPALSRFNLDHPRRPKFITYAVWWIKNKIRKAVAADVDIITKPQRKRSPIVVSLENPVARTERTLLETLVDENATNPFAESAQKEELRYLQKAISRLERDGILSPRELNILDFRFKREWDVQYIKRKLGIPTQHVHDLLRIALRKIAREIDRLKNEKTMKLKG